MSKEEKKAVAEKKPKKKGKKNIFARMWGKIKEVFSELKKVSWPTFGKVLKQTGVVIVVVLILLIIITLMDTGLTALLELLTGASLG